MPTALELWRAAEAFDPGRGDYVTEALALWRAAEAAQGAAIALDVWRAAESQPFNPSQHLRGPHGRFRSMGLRVMGDLNNWFNTHGHGTVNGPHPALAGFTQPQLKKAVADLGLHATSNKRADLEQVLVAHAQVQHAAGVTSHVAPSLPAAVTTRPAAGGRLGEDVWLGSTRTAPALLGNVHQTGIGWLAWDEQGNPIPPRVGGPAYSTHDDAVRAVYEHHMTPRLVTPSFRRAAAPASSRQGQITGPTARPWLGGPINGWGQHPQIVSHGGQDIGTIEQDPGTGQWLAYEKYANIAGAGPIGRFATDQQAMQALVSHYASTPSLHPQTTPPAPTPPITLHAALPAPASNTTNIAALAAKAKVRKNPVTMIGKVYSGQVTSGGVVIGNVHQTANGQWTALAPNWTRPASAQHATRLDAVTQLVTDALANGTIIPAGSNTATPKATLKKFAFAPAGFAEVHEVSYGGSAIGVVQKSSTGTWTGKLYGGVNLPTLGHSVRKRAVDDLVQAHLAATAPTAVPAPTLRQGGPEIQAALDVVYGIDPKGKTAARQLAVYGKLRKSHFDSLDPAEQQVVLADLSYITKMSKGANATDAKKLVDRFTPAGTPLGTVPNQSISVPASASSAQQRFATPQTGLLKMLPKAQRGASGDGWTRTTTGTSGPWGQYGAAGLLLRHVDSTGTARYLMVERGPAISDPGKWQFPGGAKEERESFYQGAAREVVEELGFQPSDLDAAKVHGTHTNEVPSVMVPAVNGSGRVPWAYVSIAADVPTQLKPDLSTTHARAETSDAKWMTEAEIADLDRKGKLLKPLAGGQLQTNVVSLFPPSTPNIASGTRPARLTGPVPTLAPPIRHKPSLGRNLIADQVAQDKLRQDIAAIRKNYRGKTADERLAAIAHLQGFDDTPTVVSKSEMDRLLATGDYIEAWRGVRGGYGTGSGTKTAAQVNEDMRSGTAYFGTGIFGNGYYLATDRSIAQGYADGTKNSLVRILIPKQAKTDTIQNIHRKTASAVSAKPYYYSTGYSNSQGTLHDEGRYAAAIGLDGIVNDHRANVQGNSNTHAAKPGRPTYTWLNRSVLIIQEADP